MEVMMKTLEDLMFSKEFQDACRLTVRDAIADANAAGLPKAYKELDRSDQAKYRPRAELGPRRSSIDVYRELDDFKKD
jgi:hypothetical protein